LAVTGRGRPVDNLDPSARLRRSLHIEAAELQPNVDGVAPSAWPWIAAKDRSMWAKAGSHS